MEGQDGNKEILENWDFTFFRNRIEKFVYCWIKYI